MKKLESLVIVVLVLLILFQTTLVIRSTNQLLGDNTELQGKALGNIALCINNPPEININCTTDINQSTSIKDNTYNCTINVTADPGESTNLTYTPIAQNGLNFTLDSQTKLVTIWANHTGIGDYSTQLYSEDNISGCELDDAETYNFRIHDINDPPYLVRNLPSFNMDTGSQLSAFFLDAYFADHDNDPLTYTVSSASYFSIAIDAGTSEVFIINPSGNCETESIYFTAKDPGNLTGDSNMVELTSICETPEAKSSSSSATSSSCEPEWQCKRWGKCLPEGIRSRECVDLHACDPNNYRKIFTEPCDYVPTCFDGIQNQDETGIDCGGICPSCLGDETCFDGVQNQDETGVDCGGEICDECALNATCFDGKKNQNETGVDCGGPCEACKEIQVPGIIVEDAGNILSSVLVGLGVLAVGFILYVLFRKQIKKAIAKMGWWLTRKQRKQILIGDADKKIILEKIRNFEDKFAHKRTETSYKSEGAFVRLFLSIVRDYYMRAFNLPTEFEIELLNQKMIRILHHESLKRSSLSYMKKVNLLETKKVVISRLHLSYMVEELKNLVLGTSRYTEKDNYVTAKDEVVEGNPYEKIIKILHNSMVALQFKEVDVAKERYLNILELYELLDEKKKAKVFGDIKRLYDHISYVLSYGKFN